MFIVGNLQIKFENKWKYTQWNTLTISVTWLLRHPVCLWNLIYDQTDQPLKWLSTGWITGLAFLVVSVNFLCHHFQLRSGAPLDLYALSVGALWDSKVAEACRCSMQFCHLRLWVYRHLLLCHRGLADKHWTNLQLSGMFLRWKVTDPDIMRIFMKGKW